MRMPYTFGTCEYVTFHSKRDFASVLKAADLEMGDYLGLDPLSLRRMGHMESTRRNRGSFLGEGASRHGSR